MLLYLPEFFLPQSEEHGVFILRLSQGLLDPLLSRCGRHWCKNLGQFLRSRGYIFATSYLNNFRPGHIFIAQAIFNWKIVLFIFSKKECGIIAQLSFEDRRQPLRLTILSTKDEPTIALQLHTIFGPSHMSILLSIGNIRFFDVDLHTMK
ncbi:hypothetical protein HMPREF3097_02420 [Corynebacterium sp. HMSC27B11]|nr:hypothetical protein HMPREF3097_02420 [Corynebacterium sp. HMSC27B11]